VSAKGTLGGLCAALDGADCGPVTPAWSRCRQEPVSRRFFLLRPSPLVDPGEWCNGSAGPAPDPWDCEPFEPHCSNCGRGLAHDEPCPPVHVLCEEPVSADACDPVMETLSSFADVLVWLKRHGHENGPRETWPKPGQPGAVCERRGECDAAKGCVALHELHEAIAAGQVRISGELVDLTAWSQP